MKKTITAIALTALLSSGLPLVFAQGTSANATTKMVKVDPICVQNAVEKRDTSLISALTTESSAIVTALTARKDAVKAALLLPTKKEVNAARKLANQNFDKSVKAARTAMRTGREAAWSTYKTEAKACGQAHVDMDQPSVSEAAL